MNIAILPARGGSKRIKGKAVRPFCGKPIIAYPLAAAKRSGIFGAIHVSTDSPAIQGIVNRLGHRVEFLRCTELADDHTPLMPVLRWVLEEYSRRGQTFKDVCLLYPCAPLIEAADLREGYRIYLRHKRVHPLLAVAEFSVPIEWAFRRREDGGLKPCQPGMFAARSQDLAKRYYDAGAFAFYSAAQILGPTPPRDKDYVSHVLPRGKAVDIDTLEDFELAEALFMGRRALRRGR